MLIVSFRSVNFGFWSRLGCSGQSANIFFLPPRSRLGFRQETELRGVGFFFDNHVFLLLQLIACRICVLQAVFLRGQNLLKPRPDWYPLGVTKS